MSATTQKNLVAGYIIGPKLWLLHVSGWDTDITVTYVQVLISLHLVLVI